MGKHINNYALTDNKINLNESDKSSKEVQDKLNIIVSEKDFHSIDTLHTEKNF